MKKGKLFGMGVGPGDTDLLTIKATKILKNVEVICSPRSAELKPSLALSIVQPILDERNEKYDIIRSTFPNDRR